MATNALTRPSLMPSLFDDFLRPWSQWFDDSKLTNKVMNMPPVNINRKDDAYIVSLAAPGLKKEDFIVKVEGNMLSISSEKKKQRKKKKKILLARSLVLLPSPAVSLYLKM